MVCVSNCCTVKRGDLENMKMQLVYVVLNRAGPVLGSGSGQRNAKFSVIQRHIQDHILKGPLTISVCLSCDYFFIISICHQEQGRKFLHRTIGVDSVEDGRQGFH